LPPDPRERLLEDKRRLLDALRELAFEHEAGHVSDDDYADRRTRYEGEAAAVLRELDRVIVPTAPRPESASASSPGRPLWTRPVMAGASALGLVVFGILLGAGVVRNTTPDPMAGQAPPGSRPLADLRGPASPDAGEGAGAALRAVTPEVLQGMLQAARASLFAGRYGEAIAAYQAVLKRDPKNVDALTHLGLVVAIGGHTDAALETLDKVLTIDPNYPPALLYRGQLLAEVKHDVPGAIRSWEKFAAVVPEGEDRQRVVRMIAETESGAAQKAPQ
jgi:cytochrome c-type biogenesis protein CcmH/NrfG